MSTFDSFPDSPNLIKQEGETITVKFLPGKPNNGSATITWTIPAPAHGCQTTNGVYAGMLIALSEFPHEKTQQPVNYTTYVADPTANSNIHAGDNINGALIVGAFYEKQKKSLNERLTTELIINDLDSTKQYFIIGYAVDAQNRYHVDGIRAYSIDDGTTNGNQSPNYPSTQLVKLNNEKGVLSTDGTTLVAGLNYQFDVLVSEIFSNTCDFTINVSLDGIQGTTYQQLVDTINDQLSLGENPPQSPIKPYKDTYFWNDKDKILQQFDGEQYNDVNNIIVSTTDPSDRTVSGNYWYNSVDKKLKQWKTSLWEPITTTFSYNKDVSDKTKLNNDYWFNGQQGYSWNGTTWCTLKTYKQQTDPTQTTKPTKGHFWYNTTDKLLFQWNDTQQNWTKTTAIFWKDDLTNLPDTTYWFNLKNNKLYTRIGNEWVNQTKVAVQTTAPPAAQQYNFWFNTDNETLKKWNADQSDFVSVDVLVWNADPTLVSSCNLWWVDDNQGDNILKVWDVVNEQWDIVKSFIQQGKDPRDNVSIDLNSLWFNTTNDTLLKWDGTQWLPITYIPTTKDPTISSNISNYIWYNTVDQKWYNRVSDQWTLLQKQPIIYNVQSNKINDVEQSLILNNDIWVTPSTKQAIIRERQGTTWVNLTTTFSKIKHKKHQQWFDTTNNKLYQWDGNTYVTGQPRVTVKLTDKGHLLFTTRKKGSTACTMIIVPGGYEAPGQAGSGFASFHAYGHHNSYTEAPFKAPPIPKTDVTETQFLFNNLPAQILPQQYGADGVANKTMQHIVGTGTDGTPDERRKLADRIRTQLGYPVIAVELTAHQIDHGIDLAMQMLRQRSDVAYRRGFFFMDLQPHIQTYRLTDKNIGFDKIVTVTSAHRFTSAFLSSAHGAGVYGQVVLQHLYNMGTYDLTSFHLVAQFVEQLEHLFATRMTFHWDEPKRLLHLHQSFVRPERILLDCAVEKTEQELMTNRWSEHWIYRYTLAQCQIMLADIRGKYATLPGAGGGIALNSADLMTRAENNLKLCDEEIDEYVVSNIENWGWNSQFTIG